MNLSHVGCACCTYLEGLNQNQRPENVKNNQTACAHVPHRCRKTEELQTREAVRHEDEFNEEVEVDEDEDDQAVVSGGERAGRGREAGGAG